MKPWNHEAIEISDINQMPEGTIGFIYAIINIATDKFYIGKKNIHSTRNIPLGKKALAERTDKRLSKKKKVIKESDWKTYMGSEPTLKEDIKTYGDDNFLRGILCFCSSKKSLTYQEIRYQILGGCLEKDNCYNSNILGKFFRSDAK